MANVKIAINGKTYGIDCGDGQEERVKKLGAFIDDRLSTVRKTAGTISEDQLFVIAALMIADELFELKENGNQTSSQNTTANVSLDGYISEEEVSTIINNLASRITEITKEVETI